MSDFTDNAKQLWRDTVEYFRTDSPFQSAVRGGRFAAAIIGRVAKAITEFPQWRFALPAVIGGTVLVFLLLMVGEFAVNLFHIMRSTASKKPVKEAVIATQQNERETRPLPVGEPWKGMSQDEFRKKLADAQASSQAPEITEESAFEAITGQTSRYKLPEVGDDDPLDAQVIFLELMKPGSKIDKKKINAMTISEWWSLTRGQRIYFCMVVSDNLVEKWPDQMPRTETWGETSRIATAILNRQPKSKLKLAPEIEEVFLGMKKMPVDRNFDVFSVRNWPLSEPSRRRQ